MSDESIRDVPIWPVSGRGRAMASVARDDLGPERATGVGNLTNGLPSRKIERGRPQRSTRRKGGSGGRRSGGGGGLGLRLFSLVLWLVPLGLLGGAGYYVWLQYEAVRSRVEVTT